MSFVVAGGGGAKNNPMLRDARGPFSVSTHGFAELSFTPAAATVTLVDGTGAERHAFTRLTDGKVTVTRDTPSDPATKHPAKTITGRD